MFSPVLDIGYVSLINTLPSFDSEISLDYHIVKCARVSYNPLTEQKEIKPEEARRLIRYLMQNYHTSPFEMVEFTFEIKAPLFVVQHFLRHRTANINQESLRYTVADPEFYIPSFIANQSKTNHQGSEGINDKSDECIELIRKSYKDSYHIYQSLIENGTSREQARMVLPVGTYTTFIYKMDLHNLLNFLRLRCDKTAQYETRQYANAMYHIVKRYVPITCEAFEDFRLNSMSLSAKEIDAIVNLDTELKGVSKGENDRYKEKFDMMKKLFLEEIQEFQPYIEQFSKLKTIFSGFKSWDNKFDMNLSNNLSKINIFNNKNNVDSVIEHNKQNIDINVQNDINIEGGESYDGDVEKEISFIDMILNSQI